MQRIQMTLGVIHDKEKILLAMKKRGFGTGKWNGFGGKVLPEETIEQALIREGKEELNIDITKVEQCGKIDFTFEEKPEEVLEVNIFKILDYSGEPEESEEMKPAWFKFNEIPYTSMWIDNSIWLPLLLEGKKFKGAFHFINKGASISKKHLDFVNSF